MKKIIAVTVSLLVVALFMGMNVSGEDMNPQGEWTGQLNLNTATQQELQMLPDMGEDMARNIVNYRTANGPLTVIDDLVKVKGFSYPYLEQIAPFIKLDGPSTLRKKE